MESLDNIEWDVLIVGTSLQQSLLALALSRSGKKVLHIDKNSYYGGAEAAFSLQEAEDWARKVDQGSSAAAFSNISVSKPEPTEPDATPSLSSSRAYSLELNPQIIYARSSLLQYLVSSKVYKQLEFLAVGSWWVYSNDPGSEHTAEGSTQSSRLLKVPNGREDVFQDQVLDFKSKRALMKFLRFIAEYEEQREVWEEHRQQPFPAFLSEQFKVPVALQAPLLALTLSPFSSNQTTTEYALPRVARHLRSIGVFGAGFGSVIPKWGGMSEIVQVACRSCAVGGGVYVLGKGLATASEYTASEAGAAEGFKLGPHDHESWPPKWIVRESAGDLDKSPTHCKSISIVSSTLGPLFPPIAEDAPPPASAVVVFPSGSLSLAVDSADNTELPPVHVLVHSADTGECPAGQSVLYASTSLGGDDGFQMLRKAIEALLSAVEVMPAPVILWSTQYQQRPSSMSALELSSEEQIVCCPPPSLDVAFDDSMLESVKEVWQRIVHKDDDDFLVFEDREADVDDEE